MARSANGIRQIHESGQPVLVGTISIEKSEHLANLLKKAGIPHQVLNAKQHEREAHIVAQAGRKGAVTVSTNMAGRGTDILLGGNPEAMTRDYCLQESPGHSLRRGLRRDRRGWRGRQQPRAEHGALPDGRQDFPGAARTVEADLRSIRRAVPRRTRRSDRPGRPAHSRHRTPRSAAHRQPASRPRRPPGRSRAPRASISRSKTTCCASSAASASRP